MPATMEQLLARDLERLGQKVIEMGQYAGEALSHSLRALEGKSAHLAYLAIFADAKINRAEKEIERLAQEFLVRHHPHAEPLRFAYSTIRVNLELERVGDYAKSIAKQVLKLLSLDTEFPTRGFEAMGNLALPMLRDAVAAFVRRDALLARKTIEAEEAVDALRTEVNLELLGLQRDYRISLEALAPLMTIARRLERVSDQAKSICQEALFVSSGDDPRHAGESKLGILFVDDDNSCRSQMAEAVAKSLEVPGFCFCSAGLEPKPVDERTIAFLARKGIDMTGQESKALRDLPVEEYQVVVGLSDHVRQAIEPLPRKTVYFYWEIPDPSKWPETQGRIPAVYDAAFESIHAHLYELTKLLRGEHAARPILRTPNRNGA